MLPKPSGKRNIDIKDVKTDTEEILSALHRKKPARKEKLIRSLLSGFSGAGLVIIFFCGLYKDGGIAGLQNTLNVIAFFRTTTATMQARWSTVEREIENAGYLSQNFDTSRKSIGFIDSRERNACAQLFEWCSLYQSIRNNGNQMLWADSLYTTDVNFWALDDNVRREQFILETVKYNFPGLRDKYEEYHLDERKVEANRRRVNEVETRIVYDIKTKSERYQRWYWIGSILFALIFIIEKVRYVYGIGE